MKNVNGSDSLIIALKKIGIHKVVLLNNLELDIFDDDIDVFRIEDARTAGYVATGMSVESQEGVFIGIKGDNDFKSLAPSITEAFYRNIPILVGVFNSNDFSFDYKNDFKDTFRIINFCKSLNNLEEVISKFEQCNCLLPGMIVFNYEDQHKQENKLSENTQITVDYDILKQYSKNDFVLISHNIRYLPEVKSDIYINDGAYGLDGAISILLGASLSKRYEKYSCVILEPELIHDINTLGNRHFPQNITIFVISKNTENKQTIKDFASSLNIDFYDFDEFVNQNDKSSIVWINEK